MTDRYDPHRAHPDTVLALIEWQLAPEHTTESIRSVVAALRDQCRLLRTQAEIALDIARLVVFGGSRTHGGAEVKSRVLLEFEGVPRGAARLSDLCTEFARAAPPAVVATAPAYGPSGAAAKESREDIAAPGGATSEGDPVAPDPEERPCGCEQTEALEKQLAALRARNFELAMVLGRIRKLVNEPWKP